MPGAFGTATESELRKAAAGEKGTAGKNLIAQVTTTKSYVYGTGKYTVVAYDFGIKTTMLNCLGEFATVHDFGAFFLADAVSGHEYLGVAVLAAGILLMAKGVLAGGEDRRLLPFAFGSACATAAYTLIDGMGARVSGAPVAYVAWVFVADGLIFTLGMLALRGPRIIPRNWRVWPMGGVAATASYGAYAVSIWAMTIAPIAVVAALRETSILFAVLIGWLVFGEKMTGEKALAALVIVAGVILTRL